MLVWGKRSTWRGEGLTSGMDFLLLRLAAGLGAASVVAPEAAVILTRRDGSLLALEATVLELTCITAESALP